MLKTANFENTSNPIPISFRYISDYYPFGSTLPTRSWSDASRAYRYGFNGKEKDFETANDNYDFGARIYDGRLGRWLSLDPEIFKYPEFSPYISFGNCPVLIIDIEGKFILSEPNEKLSNKILEVKTYVENLSEEKLKELLNTSGFKSREDILTLLTPGQGPTLIVADIVDFTGYKEGTVTEFGKKQVEGTGSTYQDALPEGITTGTKAKQEVILDDATLAYIVDGKSNAEHNNYVKQFFLHELTHVRQLMEGKAINEEQAYKVEEVVGGRTNPGRDFYKYEPSVPEKVETPAVPTTPETTPKEPDSPIDDDDH